MKEYLKQAKEIAYSECEKTGMPIKGQIDLALKKAIELAEKLNADVYISAIGSLMMDCMIGKAQQEGKLEDHIQMSYERAREWLNTTDMKEEYKENILHCVLEHHGVDSFFSKESEICCNSDCYRFASIEGFLYGVRYLRKMPFKELVNLLNKKVEEKWNTLTLDISRQELEPQYEVIKEMLKYLDGV